MDKELLFQLYAIHSPSGGEEKMREFLKRYVARNCGDCKVTQDASGNIFITKGRAETYPCLAAHIDQVQHQHSKDFQCVTDGEAVFGYSAKTHAQQGLGADDKNGIFVCLECLRKYDILKVAFFVGEEVGCAGSQACDLDFFKDCRFIIEPDRKGPHDLITSMFCGAVCSDDFIKAIGAEEYGYQPEHGSITDVGTLVERGVGISCLNLSCGYYDAHTDREFTILSELQHCLDFVQHIIETCTAVYPFTYEDPWEHKRASRGEKEDAPFFDDADYYDGGMYDFDCGQMEQMLKVQPALSFDEIVTDYGTSFFSNDVDLLRSMYDDLREYYGYDDTPDGEFGGEMYDRDTVYPFTKVP